ncbi:YadA-like family protein [Haemophilus haemolyticus]|uniref:YadA-like family protein n=1 Tax=Haemophilus haemolyticus TaxID=726 RepID=UPI000E56B128|nr:YadA-like family protein [Haemophilus haemolyticus]
MSINHTPGDLGNGNNSYNDSAKGEDSIAIGRLASTIKGADASVAIGVAATTEKPHGIAIGTLSKSKSEQGIALGGWAEASGKSNAIAIGTLAKAMNSESQAIGQLSKAEGEHSQAYGDRAEAYDVNGVAIGSSSRVSGDNSVALGAFSYVGEKNTVPPADSATPSFHTHQDKEYSIIHPTNKKKYNYGIALGALSKVFGSQGIAVGGEAHDHVSLAVGSSAVAQGYFSASIGAFAITKERDAISLGHVAQANKRGSVSLGHDAISNVESAVALGENSLADRSLDDLKSIGYDPLNKRVKMDSDGSNKEFVFDTDAEKTRYTQLSQELIELKKEANNLETEFASIVNEKNKANLSSEEERDIEQRLNQKSAELDSKLSEIKLKEHEKNKLVSVWRATAGAVSVGDHNIGITRQITNLAAGSEDTDAVNVAQLKSLKNAGLTFALNDYDKDQADSTKDKLIKKEIGSIFQIQGKSDFVYNDANKAKYTSDNLVTFNDAGVLRIGMLKSPSFTGVTLGEGDKTVSLTVDDGALKAGGKTIFTEDNFKTFFTKLYTFEGGLKAEEKDGKTVISLNKETIKQMPELKGEKGDAGKSAYEIWKAQDGNGNKSEADFTNAIKGEKGDAGKSAYEIWKAQDGNGNKSEADFTNAIKGEKGDAGKSAYEIWKAQDGNGNKSEADFTNAIKGEKGDAGKSAYEIWKAQDGNGNKSEADFTNAIKGEKGDAGKSAYEIWKAQDGNGNKSEADFTNAIKGEKGDAGKSAYEIWKAQDGNGNKSEADFTNAIKGEKGPKGEPGLKGGQGLKGEKGKSAYESWKELPANQGKSETEFAEMLGGGASKVELQQLRTEHDSLKAQIRKDQQSIQQLDRNMQKMNKDLRAGIAGATAIAFLQGGNFAGESAVSVAVGTYKGEHALAVGYGRRLTNNKIEVKLGASINSRSDVNAGGSVGYHW